VSDWLAQRTLEVEAKLKAALSKPLEASPRPDGAIYGEDEFDPWFDVVTGVYGSYDSDFDACAIEVLIEIRNREKQRHDLGAEMFREMLCFQDLCCYGTSPRYCYWDVERSLLDDLITKWLEWYKHTWDQDYVKESQCVSGPK